MSSEDGDVVAKAIRYQNPLRSCSFVILDLTLAAWLLLHLSTVWHALDGLARHLP